MKYLTLLVYGIAVVLELFLAAFSVHTNAHLLVSATWVFCAVLNLMVIAIRFKELRNAR